MTDTSMDAFVALTAGPTTFAELRTKAVDAEVLPPAGIGDNSEADENHAAEMAQLASDAGALYAKCNESITTAAISARELGKVLPKARETARHGEWKPWLKQLQIPYSKAVRCMAVVRAEEKDWLKMQVEQWQVDAFLTNEESKDAYSQGAYTDDDGNYVGFPKQGDKLQPSSITPDEVRAAVAEICERAPAMQVATPAAIADLPLGVPEHRVEAQQLVVPGVPSALLSHPVDEKLTPLEEFRRLVSDKQRAEKEAADVAKQLKSMREVIANCALYTRNFVQEHMLELLDVDENGFFTREDGECLKVLKVDAILTSRRVRVSCEKVGSEHNITAVVEIRSKNRAGR